MRELAISDAVATLDEDVVIETLGKHYMNVSATADELGVPSAELRKLLWARPKFVAAADEMAERMLDMGVANIFEAARGANAKLRFLAGCFITRYSTKAARRGWLTNAPRDTGPPPVVEPKTYVFNWGHPPPATETVERDGRLIEQPVYSRDADVVEDSPNATHQVVQEHLDVDSDLVVDVDQRVERHVEDGHHQLADDRADVSALKPLSDAVRQEALNRIADEPWTRKAVIAHLRKKGFDASGL